MMGFTFLEVDFLALRRVGVTETESSLFLKTGASTVMPLKPVKQDRRSDHATTNVAQSLSAKRFTMLAYHIPISQL